MAENKKSFIAYCDWMETFESLPDEKAGQLVKHLFRYVNDYNPESEDLLINAVFANIKQQLKRDLKKYESICERNRLNGSKGGRPKSNNKPKKPIGLSGNPNKPKKPDNDIDIDNGIDKEKKNNIYIQFDNLKITKEENNKLLELGYTQKQIDSIYESIENYKQNKKYKSLFLTAKKWLEREYQKQTNEEKFKNNSRLISKRIQHDTDFD